MVFYIFLIHFLNDKRGLTPILLLKAEEAEGATGAEGVGEELNKGGGGS